MNFPLHSSKIFVFQEIAQCYQCDFGYFRMWSGTCYAGTGMYVVCIQWVSRFGNYIFTAFDPQLKITAVRGKVFDGQDKRVLQTKMPDVEVYSSLWKTIMVQYQDRQAMAVVKGVEDNFDQ